MIAELFGNDRYGSTHGGADQPGSVIPAPTKVPSGPMPPDSWDDPVVADDSAEHASPDSDANAKPEWHEASEGLVKPELTDEEEADAEAQREAAAKALLEKLREERLAPVRAMDTADVQRLLKKKMGTVLRAHKTLTEAIEILAECKTTWAEASEATKLVFPVSDQVPPVQQFVEKSEHHFALHFEARRAAEKALLQKQWCGHEFGTALDDLLATIFTVEEAKAELADDEVLAAAKFLHKSESDFEQVQPERTLDQFVDTIVRDITEEEQVQLTKDRETVFQAALQTSRAWHLLVEQADEYTENKTIRNAGVIEPTRPSEEEVQRYLSELEQLMLKRQLSDRRLLRLTDECKQAVDKMLQFQAELTKVNDGTERLASSTEEAAPAVFAAVRDCSWTILETIKTVQSMVPKSKLNGYDSADEPTVSSTERKDIDRTRNHMRALGFAMGRLNEATVTLKGAEKKRIRPVSVDGVADADTKSWNDCVKWLADKRKDQKAVGREALSKSTKIELLKESVEAAAEEVAEKRVNLRRHVRTCLAVGYKRPCNELRAIFNASAWMSRVENEEGTFKIKLAFPVFPIVD